MKSLIEQLNDEKELRSKQVYDQIKDLKFNKQDVEILGIPLSSVIQIKQRFKSGRAGWELILLLELYLVYLLTEQEGQDESNK